ncbi:MAG: FkbM family methyltransferase [Polyangiaceae bacterium]|nr:FkbM family methyltransferase [Polyangiaceae bacterium]
MQGATLDVLRGAEKTLESCVVVQCEAEFVPLYEGEPLFAEIDLEMRRHGLLHRFLFLAERTFAPLQRPRGYARRPAVVDRRHLHQELPRPRATGPRAAAATRADLRAAAAGPDLSLVALKHHDAKQKTSLYSEYLASLTGG